MIFVIKTSGCGEIGRRAGFRFLWVTPYGFKSLHPHQRAPLWGAFFVGADEGSKQRILYGFTRGASAYENKNKNETFRRDDALPRLRKAEPADTLSSALQILTI